MDEFDGYIAELYREMELELISSMKRNLALHLAEEQKTGIKYPQWQAIKLKELKRFQRENADIIGRRTKGLSKDVSEHMQSELKEGSAHEFKVYREALGQGYKSAKAVKDSFFRVDAEKVKGVINALDNDLTTANAAMFRMVNDTYRQVIYKYGFFMANGTYTYKQAYDAATKDFLERGINCIEYKDGRRVNIADYCRMAVRTSSQRAYMVGQGEVRKRIGNPLIIITKHNTSCKLCKPFERKVLIDDVYSGGTQEDGDYMLLSQAMELGLYHPNCRHGSDTYYREREEFFKGYYKSHPELDNPLSETAADDYGEHNEAHIDNMIQRYRRLVVGSVDNENIIKYQAELRKWQSKKSAAYSFDIGEFSKKDVYYDENADYSINIPQLSDDINAALSNACKQVAEEGSKDRREHMMLIDLETGKVLYSEIGDSSSVGGTAYEDFLDTSNSNFALIHNHNRETPISSGDMISFTTTPNMHMMISVSNNGLKFIVYGNKKTKKYLYSLYQEEINKLTMEMKRSNINNISIMSAQEILVVEKSIDEFANLGHWRLDGRAKG